MRSGRRRAVGQVCIAVATALLVTLTAPLAFGQDQANQPFAEARVEPSATITVGQPVTVFVEVYVPSFFQGAPRFPDLDIRDALVIFNDRGRNLSRRIAGATWAGQERSYTIYPQRGGAYEIPRIDVEVAYSAPDVGRTTSTVSPEPVRFEVTIPPQADGLAYFIATTALTLEEVITAPGAPTRSTSREPGTGDPTAGPPTEAAPERRTLRIGDSLTRTVTVTVADALSMVIPPFDLGAPQGLATYPAQPVVEDAGGERGERIVGTRVESTTFVAEREGSYRLPAVEIAWWDVAAAELNRASADEIHIDVVANPDLVTEFALPPEDADALGDEVEPAPRISLVEYLRRWGVPLLAVLLVVVVGARIGRRFGIDVGRLFRGDPRVREEVALFRTFQQTARSQRGADTARAFMRWLDLWSRRPGTYAEFSDAADDAGMDHEAGALGAYLYGKPSAEPAAWSGRRLARGVARARRQRQKETSDSVEAALPPLNP